VVTYTYDSFYMEVFSVSYFPNILTTSLLLKSSDVFIEGQENFIKQSYRSRCYVLGPNDILTLYVPVVGGRKNIPIREICVDHSQRWADVQWRSITSAYQKAPFFEHYEEIVKKVIFSKEERLFNLALKSMTATFQMLRREFNYQLTSHFQKEYTSGERDFRKMLNKNYQEHQPDIFAAKSYQQNFGKLFVHNLSVLDIIFCEGPNAVELIIDSSQ